VPTRELIAYLALHPHGASRDELIAALWPAQDPKKTRGRLWDLATDARAALGDALIHEGERYRLDRAKVQIDLDQLDQLLASTDTDTEPTSKRPSRCGAANRSKAPTTSGPTDTSTGYAPPCSACWSAPATHAWSATTHAAPSRWPSKPSRSTSSTTRSPNPKPP
jgi:hypothetical protein